MSATVNIHQLIGNLVIVTTAENLEVDLSEKVFTALSLALKGVKVPDEVNLKCSSDKSE